MVTMKQTCPLLASLEGSRKPFFTTYHEYFAKAEPVSQYELRMELYEIFHYLNHTLIFGGHYARIAETKMDTLIAATSESKEGFYISG